MANLYELTQNVLVLQEMLENGEIDDTVYNDTLEGMGVQEKIANICKVIRNLDAKATAFKEEKDRLAKRQAACENGIKRLKESLLTHLNALDKNKVDAGLFTVSKSSSTSVRINDENKIDEFFLEPQPPKINKAEIGKALKNGIKVDGAELVKTEYVRIR